MECKEGQGRGVEVHAVSEARWAGGGESAAFEEGGGAAVVECCFCELGVDTGETERVGLHLCEKLKKVGKLNVLRIPSWREGRLMETFVFGWLSCSAILKSLEEQVSVL